MPPKKLPVSAKLDAQAILSKVLLAKKDLIEFSQYLKVFDKYREELVRFDLNPAQKELHTLMQTGRAAYVLKARQLGSSTYWIARIFWRCIRTPNHQALVVVHTTEAAQNLFNVAKRFNESVPLIFQPAPPKDVSNKQIKFPNGSLIRVTTANTESMRGQTYGSVLFSEFAYYLHPQETIAAALKTLTPNGEVYLETTANGLNWAHEQWNREPSAYAKIFLSWRLDPKARASKLVPGAVITDELLSLAAAENWSEEELKWAANTLAVDAHDNWQMFCQETPTSANMAFVTSGARVFPRLYFPHVAMPPVEGLLEFLPPSPNIPVAMGCDVATGTPNGDYSAFAIMSKDCELFATYYGRPNSMEFADIVYQQAKRYQALLAIEHPGPGAALQDMILQKGYFNCYRRPTTDSKISDTLTDKVGWLTTETTRGLIINQLHRNIKKLPLDKEPRLQSEINTFEYDKSGRPGHNSRGHDDLLFACGITMEAGEQLVSMESYSRQRRPRTTEEICQWQIDTNEIYSDALSFEEDDDRPTFRGLSDYL